MNYYDYGYGHYESVNLPEVWAIISIILAILGGVLIYFLFVKGRDLNLSDGLKKLRDILDFKIMIIEPVVKILYLVLTIYTILMAFSFLTTNFLAFIITLVLGPLLIRILYEAAIMLVMIWKNTKTIAENTKKVKDSPKEKEKKQTKEEKN